MAKLTAKQQIFCDEYLIDLNATQAAIRAGYSKKTAHVIGTENLEKPAIKEFLSTRQQARQERTEINQDYVLTVIQETIERCRVQNAEKQFDPRHVLKGCELLGKHLNIFTDTTKHEHSFTGPDGKPLSVSVSTVYVSVGDKRNG